MSEVSPRPFHHQPIETSSRNHHRFTVQPLATTSRSRRVTDEVKEKKPDVVAICSDPMPKRRLIPELIETTFKNNKILAVKPAPELTPEPSPQTPPSEPDLPTPKPRRRFAPQLIETTRRSKKAGDPKPATLPTDKTDITPGTNHIYLPRRNQRPHTEPIPHVPGNTPSSSLAPFIPYFPRNPPQRQGSMKPHLNTRRSTRQNSFLPELDSILSEDSPDEDFLFRDNDDEATPSLTESLGSSEDSMMRLQLARTRESCDDRFSGYLLELAAKAAEKQLREQALAAFPNSDYHNPVEHFYDREIDTSSDEEDAIGVGLLPHEMVGEPHAVRRKSTEVGWAAREMQQHQEHLARLREEETHRLLAEEASRPHFHDPFWTNGMTTKKAPVVDREREAELERMRKAASPPMLGDNLIFRRCPSPKPTKFETDQKIDVMHKRDDNGGGLWGGYCVADDESQFLSLASRGAPMLATPANEREDVFSVVFAEEASRGDLTGKGRPSSPVLSKGGVHMLTGLDERLKAEAVRSKVEEAIEQEFDDKFITQVYNYLSLGYPSLARQYDEELSKISRISQSELCREDNVADVKGHIGLVAGADVTPGFRCARWSALRLYVLEWARQHPDMSDSGQSPSAWGVRARRGSWAI